ncbi:unnamed protein product [Cylicocyclus nassatus]|uniref:N-acetyltransferase domain-containing protein n=1 Tax=Cylicocyclus nassatus TaxID=53992 RepID=A0AA36GSN1_CYLNA|nr:unnamed protein product [Cylicocyclus nassatus]
MLRRSLAEIRLYSQKIDPTQAFDFIPAKSADLPDIVDLCTKSFMYEEPHSKALGAKPEIMKPLFEYIVAKSLQHPYSYRIHEKKTRNLIGFRLLSIGHRDHSLEIEPITFVEPSDPALKRLFLRREITHVVPKHQRKGIANYLLHLGLDFDELRKQGIQGIVSEASSLANQRLLDKHGYKCLYKPEYNLKMHDGTERIMVFFKDLRK